MFNRQFTGLLWAPSPAVVLMCSLLAGCYSTPQGDTDAIAGLITQMNTEGTTRPHIAHPTHQIRTAQHGVSLFQYAETIALELSQQYVPSGQVAVTSYVDFDSTLQTTNSLGNQLAEFLQVALVQSGYRIAEVNSEGQVVISEQGNTILSRDFREEKNIKFAVAGTFIYSSQGIAINTRLFDLESKRILASSNIVLPSFLARAN